MLLFDIKRYSINDGPGIRITLFTKGCPLSCVWCHNPEGISPKKEILYTEKKCIGCSTCVNVCPAKALTLTQEQGIVCNKSLCITCGKCVDNCPTLVLEMSGTNYTTEQLLVEIERETSIMDTSKGGVTICGGEPLLHHREVLELLLQLGERGIHRCIDTTLYARKEYVKSIADESELLLVDLKLMDRDKHTQYCGVDNTLILDNIRYLAEAGYNFWIRIPLINGVNADRDNLVRSADFLASLAWTERKVDLLPYHAIGNIKHAKLGTVYNSQGITMEAPTDEECEEAVSIFRDRGLMVGIGG